MSTTVPQQDHVDGPDLYWRQLSKHEQLQFEWPTGDADHAQGQCVESASLDIEIETIQEGVFRKRPKPKTEVSPNRAVACGFAIRIAELLQAEPSAWIDNYRFADLARDVLGHSAGHARDTYDAAEAGVNICIARTLLDLGNVLGSVDVLLSLQNRMPRQTRRDVTQVELQQFSTPPAEALLVVVAAALRSGMVVLEPSAGTGNMAVLARLTGNVVSVRVEDAAGNPEINRENLRRQQELLDKVADLDIPHNPLDALVGHFGVGQAAEISGRTHRWEHGKYVRRKLQGVPRRQLNEYETRLFQRGHKRVAVISGAGSTGISVHADLMAGNQQRRVFYAFQLSWSADQQMQAFEREDARAWWERAYAETPATEARRFHILSGAIFPIYDKIMGASGIQSMKIARAVLSDGRALVGLNLGPADVPNVKQRLGIGTPLAETSPAELLHLLEGGSVIELDNGWLLKRSRLAGDDIVELVLNGVAASRVARLSTLVKTTPSTSRRGLRCRRTSATSLNASVSPPSESGCGNAESRIQSAAAYAATVVVAAANGAVSRNTKSKCRRASAIGRSSSRVRSVNFESSASSSDSCGRDAMSCTPDGMRSKIASPAMVSSVVRSSSVPAKLFSGTPRWRVAPAAGSRSITRQRYPPWPRAAAMLTLLVVLPTPPFWLPTAITIPSAASAMESPCVLLRCLHFSAARMHRPAGQHARPVAGVRPR